MNSRSKYSLLTFSRALTFSCSRWFCVCKVESCSCSRSNSVDKLRRASRNQSVHWSTGWMIYLMLFTAVVISMQQSLTTVVMVQYEMILQISKSRSFCLENL